MGFLIKDTYWALFDLCRLWLMSARLLRMGSTATTLLSIAAAITVYMPETESLNYSIKENKAMIVQITCSSTIIHT